MKTAVSVIGHFPFFILSVHFLLSMLVQHIHLKTGIAALVENYPERTGQGLLFDLFGDDADTGHETDCNQIGNQSGAGRGADR